MIGGYWFGNVQDRAGRHGRRQRPAGRRRGRKAGGRGIFGRHRAALWPRGRVKAACERRRARGDRPRPGRHRHARFADAGRAAKDGIFHGQGGHGRARGQGGRRRFRRFHGRAPGWRHAAHRPHPRRRAPGAGSGDSRAQKALSAHRLRRERRLSGPLSAAVRPHGFGLHAERAGRRAPRGRPCQHRHGGGKGRQAHPRGLRTDVQTDGVCLQGQRRGARRAQWRF